MEILRLENISLTYHTPGGETPAIKDLSFYLEEGEFLSVVGPSGCGKTSILSLISGLMPPSGGSIAVCGKRVTGPGADIAYMLQRDQLFEWRNVRGNVLLGLEIQRKRTPETVDYAESLLCKYGLKDFMRHHPRQLSGGMRQRVALIRTLATSPKLLLLDEPFSALDFQTRLSVCDDVHAIIKGEGKTAVLVTHDISEAVSMSDKIALLSARPATLKEMYRLKFAAKTPLERRECAEFRKWFERVLKGLA
ncbi:ABC transporter ATP-binding protein [Clostridia bacterium]|nr:ABC transporter ATP-binding protein [Clostridia bacterium]